MALDDLTVLELTAQDPDVSDNNGPEQMKKVIAQSPHDLTEIKDVIVDLTLAQDKNAQSLQAATEALSIKAKGRISASQVMALEELINGIVDEQNPIGLYTGVPTATNVDETVERVNQRAADLASEAKQATKELSERLVKLLNSSGSGTLEEVDKHLENYVRAVAAYTDVHGFTPLDFQRRNTGKDVMYIDDYAGNHLEKTHGDNIDVIDKYVIVLRDLGLLIGSNQCLHDILGGSPIIKVDGKVYNLSEIACGKEFNSYTENEEPKEVPGQIRLSSIITGIGSSVSIEYIRSLAGAMLGLASYLGSILKGDEENANADRQDAFDAVAIAVLGQALQKRFSQAIEVLKATTALYNELALTVNKTEETTQETAGENTSEAPTE